MKKFAWRLEKVLTIRKQQEDTIKMQLFEITKQLFTVRQDIMIMQSKIKSSAAELDKNVDIIYRKMFADFVIETGIKISKLEKKLQEIEKLRLEKLNQVIQAKKKRRALEILKENAFIEYTQWSNKVEQNELDDITNTASARKLIAV